MGSATSKSKKKVIKLGSSKYKIVSVESTTDIVTELIVCDTKTKEEHLLKKMLINSGSNTIDYLSGADILSRLPSHPNIVRYIGSSHFVHQDGSIEFVILTENSSHWKSLDYLMEQKLCIEFKLKLKAFEDICHAIQHCHINNIAHLSIHPRNILQDGFGTFKLTNFDSSIIMKNTSANFNNGQYHTPAAIHTAATYTRHSIFSNVAVTQTHTRMQLQHSIFISPELLDPKQYTAVLDNSLLEKGDIWSLGILLLYLLYDGALPKWYTNKLGVREADCKMFLGSYASNFVKTNMIHSNPHKRISIAEVLKFISNATEYNDPIQFLSSLHTDDDGIIATSPNERYQPRSLSNVSPNRSVSNPIDSMINKILKTNSQIFYNRLMVNFWDNNNDKKVLQLQVERVYLSSSTICNRSSLTAIKLLTLLHRLFLQTPQEFMIVSIVEIKFFKQLIEFWKVDSSQDFMKDLVISYAKFMMNRLQFHSKNRMFESNFSLSLFMYKHHKQSYETFNCNKWFEDISSSFIDLIVFGSNHHCTLINSILSHKGFNTSFAAQYANAMDVGNVLNNCLIPLFEDLHSLYLITTWIIGLLRIQFGKKKISTYSDKYKDFMISLIAVITRIKNTASMLWNSIDIDTEQFPKAVPKISSIALLDLYPPSSFAPNLSAFNRELVNYFVNIINQHHNNSNNNNKDEHKNNNDANEDRASLHLKLKRSNTHKIVPKRNKKDKHIRSRSTHIDIAANSSNPINNSRTPPPRKQQSYIHHSSSPNLTNIFPDIDALHFSEDEVEIEHEEEIKEEASKEVSFRALSRSLSSDTNIIMSPMHTNPFATLPSTANEKANALIVEDVDGDNVFAFKMQPEADQESNSSTHSSQSSYDSDIDLKMESVHELPEDELRWEDIIIIERIGIGGFAEVFSGKIINKDTTTLVMDEFSEEEEKKVAIKKLINQNLTTHNLAEFESEIDIMRSIQHPNITKFIGACTKTPHMCIVTELLEMSLFDLLHNTRLKLSIELELKVASGATKGVAHLHENNIIHRDLKSANILLDKHFEPRITDFGLSRIKDQSTLTAGTGTFQWMAPEVIIGNRKYDEKSDIYSLAIIFWEIKTGLIPFACYHLNGIQASVAVITKKKRPKIDQQIFKNKSNYNEWKKLIVTMWNQTPAARPSAVDVIKLLQEL